MRHALAAVFLCACSSSSALQETFNGCTDFTDGTTVSFGGQDGSPLFGYSPPCLHVAPGATVTFSGDFSVHPLGPGTSPSDRTAGSPNNPIVETVSGTSLTVTFPTAGTYPYFCEMHYAAGMAGVVRVQ